MAEPADPVKSFMMCAPVALNVLWPKVYSAKGGVGKVGDWYGKPRLAVDQLGSLTRCATYGPVDTIASTRGRRSFSLRHRSAAVAGPRPRRNACGGGRR
jgi:hypothetical protein